jgi:selenoprotein W-related protein
MDTERRHSMVIEFCIPCDFRPQAIELTRELLDGWAERLSEIRLIPSSGGRFEVTLDDVIIFSKAALDRHAEPGEIAAAVTLSLGPHIQEQAVLRPT